MERDDGEYIHVTVRIRPLSLNEVSNNEKVGWHSNSNVNCVFQIDEQGRNLAESSFAFDTVLGEDATEEDTYSATCPLLLQSFLSGINAALIAYGLTSSGMTSALYGINRDSGIVNRLVSDILLQCQYLQSSKLSVSFVEIYRENVIDLLKPKTMLTIHENASKGVYVESARVSFTSMEEFSIIVKQGLNRCHVSQTHMNSHSSRSHTILYLILQQSIDNQIQESIFQIVDLAGAQHIRNTGVTGVLLEEAKKINFGLSAFTKVIRLLNSGQDSVSYMGFRDSRLTRLLQSCLDRTCQTSLLLCMTPAASYSRETASTLQIGRQVQGIVICPRPTNGYNQRSLIHRLQGEVLYLRNQMNRKNKKNETISPRSSVFTRISEYRCSCSFQSEVPTICQDLGLDEIEKENLLLREELNKHKIALDEAANHMELLRDENNNYQDLLRQNNLLLAKISRLQKENDELRQLNELYNNNSKSNEEEHSFLIKEVVSLRSELSDCEEAAAHFSTCISEMEKFLSSR